MHVGGKCDATNFFVQFRDLTLYSTVDNNDELQFTNIHLTTNRMMKGRNPALRIRSNWFVFDISYVALNDITIPTII